MIASYTQLEGEYSLFNLNVVCLIQDGEIWTFSVRAFGSALPEHTINVNYEGFAEGKRYKITWLVNSSVINNICDAYVAR